MDERFWGHEIYGKLILCLSIPAFGSFIYWSTLIEKQHNAEVALSSPEFEPPVTPSVELSTAGSRTTNRGAKILAILGESKDLDLKLDQEILAAIPGAEPVFLPAPRIKDLSNSLWESSCSVLFFAGHSSSDSNTGRIYINETESLSVGELKNSLKKAVANGLQLAIFNSCDGISLARALADLQIPLIIVMREPVPDVVAQEFLKYLLKSYSSGADLPMAVREARTRLESLEGSYPCATWLPIIYQASPKPPLTWKQLCRGIESPKKSLSTLSSGVPKSLLSPLLHSSRIELASWRFLLSARFGQTVLLMSAIATATVMAARYVGWLEKVELGSFDQMQWVRSAVLNNEKQESRILVVGITEADLKIPQQELKATPRQGSLSDQALWLALKKLTLAKAQVIGLDVYHDFPASIKPLANYMKQSKRLVAVCKISDKSLNTPGIAPAPELPQTSQGFSDTLADSDGTMRRYLAMMSPPAESNCSTSYSFSLELAMRYLATKYKIVPKYNNSIGYWQLGTTVIPRLQPHSGVYQQADILGYQSLLNYRYYQKSPLNFVQQVTLDQLLNGQVNSQYIAHNIVLIGVTNFNAHDDFATPLTDGHIASRAFGVIGQAQMVSQLISAVLDGRPLLWFWPWWGDLLWVFLWSSTSLALWRFRAAAHLGLVVVVIIVALYVGCFVLLVSTGSWVPFFPSVLAVMGTSSGMLAWMYSQRARA